MTIPQDESRSSKADQGSPSLLLFFSSSFLLLFPLLVALTLVGCATSEETSQLRRSTNSISYELEQFRDEVNSKLSAITKEQESLRRQFIALSSASENRDDKVRATLGRIDELDHQLQTYWKDTKAELTILKTENIKAQTPVRPRTPPKQDNSKYETAYREAFDAFQKGSYEEAVDKFSGFISAYPGNPLVANAYYWLGESYMGLKNYEKAIVTFQEVVDKYPASDKTSRALLSQAEAFSSANDEKSSITILKKVIELYPKTEEATIAERRLRNLGLR
jgi:tol-pal system protein YbgF